MVVEVWTRVVPTRREKLRAELMRQKHTGGTRIRKGLREEISRDIDFDLVRRDRRDLVGWGVFREAKLDPLPDARPDVIEDFGSVVYLAAT